METMRTNSNDNGLLEEHTSNRKLSGEGLLEESTGNEGLIEESTGSAGLLEESTGNEGLLEESTGSEGLLEETEYHINSNYCSECGNKYSSPSIAFCPQCGHPRKVKKTW